MGYCLSAACYAPQDVLIAQISDPSKEKLNAITAAFLREMGAVEVVGDHAPLTAKSSSSKNIR